MRSSLRTPVVGRERVADDERDVGERAARPKPCQSTAATVGRPSPTVPNIRLSGRKSLCTSCAAAGRASIQLPADLASRS